MVKRTRTTGLDSVSDVDQHLPPTRLLITARDAAFALSMSPRKLWAMTNAGQIPCVRLGRCIRYSPAELQSWIEGQQS
jgi:predicted DNA-binding transcriptional regulator AlpA